jgi:hypothetical protein
MDSKLVLGLKLKEKKANMDRRRQWGEAAPSYKTFHGVLSGPHRASLQAQQIFGEGETQLDAQETDSGQSFIWREERNLVRCPGKPCDPAPYFWRDLKGKEQGSSLPGLPHEHSDQVVTPPMSRLNIPGLLDTAVERYSDWQQSRVGREDQKNEIRNVCNIVLDHGLDLQQIYDDQDSELFIKQGIKVGIARRFIRDIEYWVQQHAGTEGRIIFKM